MNKAKIEKEILRDMKAKLSEKERIYNEKIKFLRKENKNFKEIEQKYKDLIIKAAENSEFLNELMNAENIYKKFLKDAKIEDIKFSCKKCNDSGFINNVNCECLNKKINDKIKENCGISELNLLKFVDSNLDIFPKESKKNTEQIYRFFEKEVNNFKETHLLNYIVCGKSGVGKTFLFSAIAGELLERGITTFYLTAFNLNDLFLKYHTTFSEDRVRFLAPILESDALLIDDLGTEQILKNVTLEYLLVILKERKLLGKKTFINTNLLPEQILEKYDERIFSRMFDKSCSIAINFENENMRI